MAQLERGEPEEREEPALGAIDQSLENRKNNNTKEKQKEAGAVFTSSDPLAASGNAATTSERVKRAHHASLAAARRSADIHVQADIVISLPDTPRPGPAGCFPFHAFSPLLLSILSRGRSSETSLRRPDSLSRRDEANRRRIARTHRGSRAELPYLLPLCALPQRAREERHTEMYVYL